MSIADFDFTLESLFGANTQYQLKKVSEWREFDESRAPEDKKVLGFKYQVAELDQVVKFVVKVAEASPVITNEDLQKSASPVFVTFANSRAKIYGKGLYDCDLSVTAEKAIIKSKPQA
jgi:hypothetical protein